LGFDSAVVVLTTALVVIVAGAVPGATAVSQTLGDCAPPARLASIRSCPVLLAYRAL